MKLQKETTDGSHTNKQHEKDLVEDHKRVWKIQKKKVSAGEIHVINHWWDKQTQTVKTVETAKLTITFVDNFFIFMQTICKLCEKCDPKKFQRACAQNQEKCGTAILVVWQEICAQIEESWWGVVWMVRSCKLEQRNLEWSLPAHSSRQRAPPATVLWAGRSIMEFCGLMQLISVWMWHLSWMKLVYLCVECTIVRFHSRSGVLTGQMVNFWWTNKRSHFEKVV